MISLYIFFKIKDCKKNSKHFLIKYIPVLYSLIISFYALIDVSTVYFKYLHVICYTEQCNY